MGVGSWTTGAATDAAATAAEAVDNEAAVAELDLEGEGASVVWSGVAMSSKDSGAEVSPDGGCAGGLELASPERFLGEPQSRQDSSPGRSRAPQSSQRSTIAEQS